MTADPTDGRSPRSRRLAVGLILAVTAFRALYLLFLCPYDLAPDEGHYWDWSRHPDWSYYSKGPLVAWVIRAGCEVFGGLARTCNGDLMPAVRLPAVLFGAGTLAAVYVLTFQTFRSDRLAFGVVLVVLSLPTFLALSVVMTIDAPFLFCWAWALVCGRWAVVDGKAWAWPAAGLCIALGILAKYTMALGFGSVVLFLLFTPSHRRLLVRPGFWVMAATAGLSAIPILLWNAANDWVTFRHVAVQAGVAPSPKNGGFQIAGPVVYVGEQLLPLFGFWFVLWVLAVVRFRPTRVSDPGVRYVWWTSVPTFALFGAASLVTKVQVNWPVAAYVSGAVLIGGWFAEVGRHRRSVRMGARAAVGLGLLVSLVAHDTTRFFVPVLRPFLPPETPDRPTPVRALDVAARLKGWKYLAEELDRLRAEVAAGGEDPLLAGTRWDVPGCIGFYCEGHPPVYSFGLRMKDRHSQYDLWHPNPIDEAQEYLGRTFLVVAVGNPAADLRPAFASVGPPHEVVYRENGVAVAVWNVCVARGFKGFPPTARTGPVGH